MLFITLKSNLQWVGGTVIIMQISFQIALDWNWPTGTELGNKPSHTNKQSYIHIAFQWINIQICSFFLAHPVIWWLYSWSIKHAMLWPGMLGYKVTSLLLTFTGFTLYSQLKNKLGIRIVRKIMICLGKCSKLGSVYKSVQN